MVLAQALFAGMAAGARFVSRDIPWQEVAATRMLVALLLTFGMARARGRSLTVTDRKHAWLRSIFGTIAAAATFYVYAQPALPLGDAATILATAPIFIALLSWPLLGEHVSRALLLFIALSFAGVAAVARPSFHASLLVVGVCLVSAVSSAFAMMWLRRIGPGESSEAIVFHFMAVGTASLGALAIPVWRTPDARSLGFLLFTRLSGGLAQLAMTRAYALDRAARVSAVGYTGVVCTRLLAIPLFGEIPSALQWVGSAVVVAAGVGIALGERRR
jgi:drug/metabolite transporter (DMT)-like permease